MEPVTIAELNLFRFRLKLKRPLVLKNSTLDSREGLLIKITSDEGIAGWGEIAPLPAFSMESLEQAQSDAVRLRRLVRGDRIPVEVSDTSVGFDAWIGGSDFVASVRFGFETAVLRVIAAERQTTLAKILGASTDNRIQVNALLSGTPEVILNKARVLREQRYSAFKVKIGELPVEETVSLVREVRRTIGSRALLRLDLNRRWNIERCLAFFERTESDAIDYVEEPGENINQLRKIIKEKGRRVPVALDESLMEIVPDDLLRASGIKAIIIKPTLLGFERARRFALSAREAGIEAVISSSFESSIGIYALASLAAAVNANKDIPTRLDTLDWLGEDLVERPIVVTHGTIRLSPDNIVTVGIREKMLEEITYD